MKHNLAAAEALHLTSAHQQFLHRRAGSWGSTEEFQIVWLTFFLFPPPGCWNTCKAALPSSKNKQKKQSLTPNYLRLGETDVIKVLRQPSNGHLKICPNCKRQQMYGGRECGWQSLTWEVKRIIKEVLTDGRFKRKEKEKEGCGKSKAREVTVDGRWEVEKCAWVDVFEGGVWGHQILCSRISIFLLLGTEWLKSSGLGNTFSRCVSTF